MINLINEENFISKYENEEISNLTKSPFKRDLTELVKKGFVIIDKDVGPTSHTTAENLKNLLKDNSFEISKAGHSGTLDPKVSGILIAGIENSTRLMEYMLKSDKVYICLIHIHTSLNFEKIEKCIKENFVGKIKQLPPIVSAVKREERIREIYSIDILDKTQDNKYLILKVSCQHGTYMRKLCTDIGEKLNTKAQMAELRRVKAGPFKENDKNFPMISLDKLRNLFSLYQKNKENIIYETELRKYIFPYEFLLKDFKKIIIQDTAIESLSHGRDLAMPGIIKFEKGIKKDEIIGLFSSKFELVAIGKSLMEEKELKKNEKGLVVKTNKIFWEEL
jgi:H/ACA ribonucleoprotein complex subunit 4